MVRTFTTFSFRVVNSRPAACILRCRESKSVAYREFEDPVIKYREEGPPTHYLFVCKQYAPFYSLLFPSLIFCSNSCGTNVQRMIGTAETSTLLAHIQKCAAILKEQELLNSFGITGGNSSKMTPEEVREGFALWIASNNRAFSQVNDSYVSTFYPISFRPS